MWVVGSYIESLAASLTPYVANWRVLHSVTYKGE